jgi:hypothetical protein
VTWLNPWAFAGFLALAIPVLIHLLGRRNARVQRFPTLRFLGESRAVSTSRTRLSDIPLLSVRLAILAAAVAALAQPLVLTIPRRVAPYRSMVRAIILDTSASMLRATPSDTGSRTAIEWARLEARREADAAGASVVLETAQPASALAGAAAWTDTRPGPPSIVVISDFQRGTLDSSDVAGVPAHIGVRSRLAEVAKIPGPIEAATTQRGSAVTATVTPSADRTDVEWLARTGRADQPALQVLVLSGSGERTAANAAVAAAVAFTVVPPTDTARSIAIIHRQFEQRAQLLAAAEPLRVPWQGDALARLRRDPTLLAAAAAADIIGDGADDVRFDSANVAPFVVVARTRAGRPVALAAAGEVEGRQRLLLFPRIDAGSLTSAALIGAALRAASPVVPATELEPETLGRETTSTFSRPLAVNPGRLYENTGASDGRWLWLAAIALLAVEWRMRRSRRTHPVIDVRHERAA